MGISTIFRQARVIASNPSSPIAYSDSWELVVLRRMGSLVFDE